MQYRATSTMTEKFGIHLKFTAAQQSVQWTVGMANANALALGDVRWKLTRPICVNFKQFSTP